MRDARVVCENGSRPVIHSIRASDWLKNFLQAAQKEIPSFVEKENRYKLRETHNMSTEAVVLGCFDGQQREFCSFFSRFKRRGLESVSLRLILF